MRKCFQLLCLLMVTMNHISSFFSPFVCVCVHMHSQIISYYVSFFLHQKEYTAWKRSMQTFLFFFFFLLKFWLRKFLALIGFLWVWSITELCMEDANLKSSGFTVCTSVACHLKVILDSAWNRLEWFSKIRVLEHLIYSYVHWYGSE